MKKILISVLGKGRQNDYELTEYKIENFPAKKSKLVSDILQDFIQPDKTYIVGTNESLWHVADEYIKDYEKVIIPFGKNSDEFWQMFKIFSGLPVENSEIHFDITHGFRSIPLFVSTILNFFKNQKNAKITGVYYGIFEAKENDITPVVNMLPFIELNNWVEASNIFKKYGDGREIKQLIQNKFKDLAIKDLEKVKQYKEIKNIANELDVYTKSVGFSAVDIYLDSLKKIDEKIDKIVDFPTGFEAFAYIVEDLDSEASKFQETTKKWQKYLKACEVLYEKNRYAQSLTILRETLHYYIYEQLGVEMKLRKFDEIIAKIIADDTKRVEKHENTRFFHKGFIQIVGKIKTQRNFTNHAFMGSNVSARKLGTFVNELKNLIEQSKKILSNEDTLIDKNLLLNEIGRLSHEKNR